MEFSKTGVVFRISPSNTFNFLKVECKTSPGYFTVLLPVRMRHMIEEKKLYIFSVNETNHIIDIEEIKQLPKAFTTVLKTTILTNATQVLIFDGFKKKIQVVIADKDFDFTSFFGKKVKIVIDKKFGNIVHFKDISIVDNNIEIKKEVKTDINMDIIKESNMSLSITATSYYLTLNGTIPQYIAKFDNCKLTYNGLEFRSANKIFFFPFFSNTDCLCDFSLNKSYYISYKTINSIDTIIDLMPIDSSFDKKVNELQCLH